MNTDLSHQRLKLSLMGKKSSADGSGAEGTANGDPLGGLQPGDVIPGTVREVETAQVWLITRAHDFVQTGHMAETCRQGWSSVCVTVSVSAYVFLACSQMLECCQS